MTDETIVTSIEAVKEEGEKKPYLTFVKGSRLGQIESVKEGGLIVGRSPDAGLFIEDNAISRKHFNISNDKGVITIEDLGSTNGTYVNGQRISKTGLKDGDRIQISKNTILELDYMDDVQSFTEKKRYEMGVKDAVTNIYNKRYFMDRIIEEFAFAVRKNKPLSLIMIDLDHFKEVNDTHGHLAGDLVLQKVAGEIGKTIRSEDVFARYGGEEFVILMRDATLQNALDLAERIRNRVGGLQTKYEGHVIVITLSCGIAALSPAIKTPDDLIAEADKYLYVSKNSGRNRVTGPTQ